MRNGTVYWVENTLHLDFRLNGKRRRPIFARNITGTEAERRSLEKQAEEKLISIAQVKDSGSLKFSDIPTFNQAAHFYWDKCQSIKPYMKDQACWVSEWTKQKFAMEHFTDRLLDEITREDIKLYRIYLRSISGKGKRPWGDGYINRLVAKIGQIYHCVISQEQWYYKTAPDQEKAKYGNINACVSLENPCHGLPRCKENPKEAIVPTMEQFKALLQTLRPDVRCMAMISASTGLRKRNVLFLKKSETDLIEQKIKIPDHKGRTAPTVKVMTKELVDMFWDLYLATGENDSPYWFADKKGKSIGFRAHWNNCCKNAGLVGFQFKHIRTAYASWRVDEGASLPILQRQMDHSTPTTTGRFYNRSTEASKTIVEKQRSILD